MQKTFWRCTVCGDIHYGLKGPETCPTCHQIGKYVAIEKEEAVKQMTAPEK